jgi:hypothetical protein
MKLMIFNATRGLGYLRVRKVAAPIYEVAVCCEVLDGRDQSGCHRRLERVVPAALHPLQSATRHAVV